MKILVTGGTGYIGSHTAVELVNQGYEVIIIDNLSNSERFILDRIKQITGHLPKFYECDLVDYEKVSHIFAENRDIQGVIHFAAYKAVGESVEKPLNYYRNNLVSLINLLEIMDKYQVANCRLRKMRQLKWLFPLMEIQNKSQRKLLRIQLSPAQIFRRFHYGISILSERMSRR